jgi:hypothetical protein
VVDLTAGVHSSAAVSLGAKLAVLNAVLPFRRGARAAALRAFRGGLHLERLYAAGAMRYLAFFYSHEGMEPR